MTQVSRRSFLVTTTAAATTIALAQPAFGAAATVKLVADGTEHLLAPASLHNTTMSDAGRVSMRGQYSEFSVVFPYAQHLERVNLWLTPVTPKKGNLWLKLFDKDGEEWGTLATRVDPVNWDGRTRLTFEPQRLSLMTWSAKVDQKLTYPLRKLVVVFFPDDKTSPDPFDFDLESIELTGDGGPVTGWSREGAVELVSGAERVLIDQHGRLMDWNGAGRVQAPGVLPWAVSWDNGTSVYASDATVAVTRTAPDEATLTHDVPGFVHSTTRVRLAPGHLELTPVAVQNRWTRPISRMTYPEAAYRTLADGILAITPKWGGMAHTRNVLKNGFFANYGMPTATHDLILFEEPGSALGVYSVQPKEVTPYQPTMFGVVGARSREEDLSGFTHRVDTWIEPGETGALPPVRLVHGTTAFDLFARYRDDNGVGTWPSLAAKLSPALHARLAKSLHLKMDMWEPVGGTWASGRPEVASEYLKAVPGGPYSVELASYYADGRHDHNYPDFLTFDYLGGAARFKQLIDLIHARGFLASAYTNPTWFHDGTKGVAALGGIEAIGIRDGRGRLVTKTHTGNLGYLVGVWRPNHQKFITDQLRAFRDLYGMDMMFQDEIARREYDHSADFAGPPHAYCQGLVELTGKSGAIVPIGTEGVGGDRLFRHLSSSLGFYLNTMQRDRAGTYDNPNRNGVTVQQWPLGTAVMHDRVAFYPHNLDRSIDTTENLSWALAFGLNMHYQAQAMEGDFRMGRGFEAIKALSIVQREVASRCFGRAMTGFRYTTEDLKVSHTTFDGGLEIVASHDLQPRTLDLPGGLAPVPVAPHGFVAVYQGRPLYALTADQHHAPGYLSRWERDRFVPEIAWYPADLAGYRSNVIKSDLKLTVSAAELPATGPQNADLAIAGWDGAPVDLTGARVTYEVSDRSLAGVRGGRLVTWGGGRTGWVTVRAVVTRDGVPAYSSVELVKLVAGA